MPMIIPLPVAQAQQTTTLVSASTDTPVQPLKQVASPEVVQVEQPKVEIVVTQSEYDKEQQAKQLAAEKAAAKVVVAQVTTTVPEDIDKQQLVQQAAAAFGVNWKVLAAVWQVESGQQLYTTEGSSAGARGPLQFMPGTWNKYAKDGNGDGIKSIYDARDALYAAADLLASNGAAGGDNTKALLAYNHAMWYVNKVMAIANSL